MEMLNKLVLISLVFGLFSACAPVKDQGVIIEPIAQQVETPEKISFPSLDGLEISANAYIIDSLAPVILLCHQARFNKFEYAGIAEPLNALGFNCIAIDQRSGGPISIHQNETAVRAEKAGKETTYLDAEQDIQAAINYVSNNYMGSLILWGSSYSSTLALYLALEDKRVDAVLSFSPGNYFADEKGSLTDLLKEIEKPLFVTSSKQESASVSSLFQKMKFTDNQIQFVPESDGFHGSKVLWNAQPGGEEYWKAVESFLKSLQL